jgi:hypothetical protein
MEGNFLESDVGLGLREVMGLSRISYDYGILEEMK